MTVEIFYRKSFESIIIIRYNIVLTSIVNICCAGGTRMARAKEKSVFFCQECGYESAKWLGKCPGCGQWNTFVEELVSKQKKDSSRTTPSVEAVALHEISYDDMLRIDTGIQELNRVLGGGMVPGALMLLAGDPGIGKSTLTMQLCGAIKTEASVLYVSGEESRQQLKMRAQRLDVKNEKLIG